MEIELKITDCIHRYSDLRNWSTAAILGTNDLLAQNSNLDNFQLYTSVILEKFLFLYKQTSLNIVEN